MALTRTTTATAMVFFDRLRKKRQNKGAGNTAMVTTIYNVSAVQDLSTGSTECNTEGKKPFSERFPSYNREVLEHSNTAGHDGTTQNYNAFSAMYGSSSAHPSNASQFTSHYTSHSYNTSSYFGGCSSNSYGGDGGGSSSSDSGGGSSSSDSGGGSSSCDGGSSSFN